LINYTLQFVPRSQRICALQGLSKLLSPQGVIVCVAKTGSPVSAFSSSVLEHDWLQRARRKIVKSGLDAIIAPEELGFLLEHAAAGRTVRRLNLPSLTELENYFRAAGLQILGQATTPRMTLSLTDAILNSDVESSVVIVAGR
jgi:hypothetical protein